MKPLLVPGLALAMLTVAAAALAATPPAPDAPPPEAMRMPMPMPPPPSKAAHIRIEDGDAAIDVKCADDEPTKACVEITLQLLDKIVSLPKPQPQ